MFLSSQEVETEQYFTLFLPALKERGYDGFFSPKSRAKIMSEQERKHVDGCAIFFKTEKWVKETKRNNILVSLITTQLKLTLVWP